MDFKTFAATNAGLTQHHPSEPVAVTSTLPPTPSWKNLETGVDLGMDFFGREFCVHKIHRMSSKMVFIICSIINLQKTFKLSQNSSSKFVFKVRPQNPSSEFVLGISKFSDLGQSTCPCITLGYDSHTSTRFSPFLPRFSPFFSRFSSVSPSLLPRFSPFLPASPPVLPCFSPASIFQNFFQMSKNVQNGNMFLKWQFSYQFLSLRHLHI